MSRRVEFSPEAQADLISIYDYIADRGGEERSLAYIGRIEAFCRSLATFPERGRLRDDLRPGLRVIGFERRVAIAVSVAPDVVSVLRVLYGGRDADAILREP